MAKSPLIESQRRKEANKAIGRMILKKMNARRGACGLNHRDFAKKIGIGESTWRKWRDTDLECADLYAVLNAVHKAGVELTISVDARI